ncbi:GOLPH3/VPS74 family protein [Yinghuangia sp. YIM S09857]|uniref:GOLPH3/VPS74 family protein n=1 Tax=Yinghuangia sp. YIM S09857 TaxID=3436929 RepID=UPI003F52DF14
MEAPDDVSLAHRAFLLACQPERQRVGGTQHLGLVLHAAVLQDLLDAGLLADEGGKARATASHGTAAVPGGALETAVYARISASDRPRSWRHWIAKSAGSALATVRDELARSRVIRVEESRILLVFPRRAVSLRRPRMRTAAMAGVRDALRPTQPPARVARRQAATAVFAHLGEMSTVMSGRERREARGRIAELSEGLGPVPEALRKAVRDAKAASSDGG